MRLVFWGTPEFAAVPLRALLGEGFDVVAVVTQPDRPHGRSRSRLVPPPVKEVAAAAGIPVVQPERPRGPEFLAWLRDQRADLSVVVAYGHILLREVIDLPRLGTWNIHASLLPALRGAAPIQAAIREGLVETGVTIMRMVPALDAGPILLQQALPIAADETAGELTGRLAELGAQALIEALERYAQDALPETPQDDGRATFAPKVSREDALVRWTDPAVVVARTIRAYDPKPGAWSVFGAAETRLFGPQVVAAQGDPGTVLSVDAYGMTVACGSGAVRIREVHPAGKRRMTPHEWAAGWRESKG
jgi:methionyl-tRNA formyltransferase